MSITALNQATAFAATEWRVLWRERTALMFIFLLPAVLSLILGPAVSGTSGEGATGQAAIGFAVMFSYMVVTYVGHAFYRDYWYVTYRRHALIQPSFVAYVVGKSAPAWSLAFVQLIVFMTFAVAFLGLPLSGDPLQLVVTGAALVTTGAGLGFLIFSITKFTATLSNLAYLILITFAGLGGAIVVSSELPAWSRSLGYATPHFWALRGIRESTLGNGDWSVVLVSAGVLAVMSLAFYGVGYIKFDYRGMKKDTL